MGLSLGRKLMILPKCNFRRFCGFTIIFIKGKLEISNSSTKKFPNKRHGNHLAKAKELLTVIERLVHNSKCHKHLVCIPKPLLTTTCNVLN